MAEPRRSHAVPMRALRVASALLALLAIAAMARPVWDALVELFAEPWPDRGAAVLLFTNEQPEEIWMVSLQVGGSEHVHEWPPDRRGWVVRRPAGPPRPAEFGPKIVSAVAGQHRATIVYEVGGDPSRLSFDITFELTPLTQCDVRIVFRVSGPTAPPCQNPHPAAYGGTWPH